MKKILFIALALSVTASFAGTGKVFCKDSGRIINVLSQDGFDCQGALLMGDVCFTGNAKEAAAVLSSQEVDDYFDGTDGEMIKYVRVKNNDTITYLYVDQANDWKDGRTIKRCLGSWFRN